MYHSIIISGKNTYDEWQMIPTSRPLVNPPEVKTTYLDNPGGNGSLDYTDSLTGTVLYGQRTGSWEFWLKPEAEWANVYSSLLNYLHGIKHTVILEDDPGFIYAGRLKVNAWKSDQHNSLLTLDYNLDPFKMTANEGEDWLWDDYFNRTIHYKTFKVYGDKYITFVNSGASPIIPTITCSETTQVIFNGQTYTLMKGLNSNKNLSLAPGNNVMQFIGESTIHIRYQEVSL